MKLISTIILIALFSTSLLIIVPVAHAQGPHPSECASANVGPLELDSASGPSSYTTTVYLYRGAILNFTQLAGYMLPSVLETSTGNLSYPYSAGPYTFVAPADGFYTIQVSPSLGYTMFSLHCDETLLHPTCRSLIMSSTTIPDSYERVGTFFVGEVIVIDMRSPFELSVNGVPYTPSAVTFVNYIIPADGKYRLVIKSWGSNFANYMRCDHL